MNFKSSQVRSALVYSLPFQVILFYFLTKNKEWIENFYIPFIFNKFTIIFRTLLGWIPFSVGLLCFYALLIFIIWKIIIRLKFLRKKVIFLKQLPRVAFKMLVIMAIVYPVYMTVWGLAYHRRSISEIVEINTTHIAARELQILCEKMISLTNESRKSVKYSRNSKVNFEKLFKQAFIGYRKMSEKIPQLNYKQTSIKIGFNKQIMSYLSTSGIYFPFTAEANINENSPVFQAPFVICHEMAHQLSFASEDEASYIAYISCRNNPDPVFQYAANHWILFMAMRALEKADEKAFKILNSKIDKEVVSDRNYSLNLWRHYNIPLQDFTSGILYDLFLKANNQESGINSYNQVVELMIGEYRKNQLTY